MRTVDRERVDAVLRFLVRKGFVDKEALSFYINEHSKELFSGDDITFIIQDMFLNELMGSNAMVEAKEFAKSLPNSPVLKPVVAPKPVVAAPVVLTSTPAPVAKPTMSLTPAKKKVRGKDKKPRRHLAPWEKELLKDMALYGCPDSMIADFLGIGESTVCHYRKINGNIPPGTKYNLSRPPKPFVDRRKNLRSPQGSLGLYDRSGL